MTPAREAEIRATLVTYTYLVAMPRSQALAWQAVRDLLAELDETRAEQVEHVALPLHGACHAEVERLRALVEALEGQSAEHVCALPPSIRASSNTGGGSSHP